MDSASFGKRVMRFARRVMFPLFTLLVCFAVVTSSFASDAPAVRPVPVTANRVTIDDAFYVSEVNDPAGGVDQRLSG